MRWPERIVRPRELFARCSRTSENDKGRSRAPESSSVSPA